jgi:hypothetical protein
LARWRITGCSGHPASRCPRTVLPPICRPTGRYAATRGGTERYERRNLALRVATVMGGVRRCLAVSGTVGWVTQICSEAGPIRHPSTERDGIAALVAEAGRVSQSWGSTPARRRKLALTKRGECLGAQPRGELD